jgi:predicted nucleotidyltransferase
MVRKFQIELPRPQIAEFCREWQVSQLALFGSVLREDFRPQSDVDVLVTFSPSAGISAFDLSQMEQELGHLLGRKVDLVERRLIEQSDNYIRRKNILESAEPVYGS